MYAREKIRIIEMVIDEYDELLIWQEAMRQKSR